MLRHLAALRTIPTILEKIFSRNKSHVLLRYDVRVCLGISIRFAGVFAGK